LEVAWLIPAIGMLGWYRSLGVQSHRNTRDRHTLGDVAKVLLL